MNHCCDKFKEHAENYATPSGGGWAYAGIFPMPTAQFVFDSTSNNWNINGCCGGGCYVVSDMTHCPFCGAILGTPATMQNTRRGRSCAVMLLIAAGALLCVGAFVTSDTAHKYMPEWLSRCIMTREQLAVWLDIELKTWQSRLGW